MLLTPVERQEDGSNFKTSLDYKARPYFKQVKGWGDGEVVKELASLWASMRAYGQLV